MVQPLGAYVWARNAPNVSLHEHCIDSHCMRTIFDKICSNLVFVKGYNAEIRNLSSNLGLVKSADLKIIARVRIVFFSHKSTSFECVFKGTIHQPTIAPRITRTSFFRITLNITIHKLLLAKAHELPCGQKIGTLQCSSGTERPARPACSLIFNYQFK
nr:hypothetical protein Iba_chr05eCG12630 [Ipomoea batatas]